jgi:hypothetical protein
VGIQVEAQPFAHHVVIVYDKDGNALVTRSLTCDGQRFTL